MHKKITFFIQVTRDTGDIGLGVRIPDERRKKTKQMEVITIYIY